MRLNTIVQAMTLTLSVTVVGGIYFIYQQWNESIRDEAHHHASSTVKNLNDEISIYLEVQAKPVKALANLPATHAILETRSPERFAEVNQLLDIFCSSLDALTCYIMDKNGTTVTSSNRNTPKSFIGKNYSFRPYFKKAIEGEPYIYLALGVTSKKRGIYFSYPVMKDNKILGVVVIKFSVARLEQKFANLSGIAVLGDLNGMVFATNRKEWLFKTLWGSSVKRSGNRKSGLQFGAVKPSSVGLFKNSAHDAMDVKGNRYLIRQKVIDDIPGWKIYYFYNDDELILHQNEIIKRLFSSGIGLLLVFLAAITFYLYMVAKKELRSREQAENKMLAAQHVAELASQAKSEFLSRMSHELRTPLNAILGFGQILELNKEHLNQSQQNHIKEIISAGRHLLDLINEVLDMAKIESGSMKVSITEISVDEVLHDCLTLISTQAEKSNIEVVDNISGNDFKVQADSLRLKQVLLNLLSNAVKYNSSPGSITLSAYLSKKNTLRINIIDTGEGLTPAQIERLFHSFDRLTGRDIEGTGIGLVISKGLVELMGGKIGVESNKGEGCTFWIELKLP